MNKLVRATAWGFYMATCYKLGLWFYKKAGVSDAELFANSKENR